MRLYRRTAGWTVEHNGCHYPVLENSLDALLAVADLTAHLAAQIASSAPLAEAQLTPLAAPVDRQEVWAAGVTYFRSRSARMEESKDAGGGDFYDRVYSAERPELFFKAQGYKVSGPGSTIRIRSDARWSVPEPELALVVDPRGGIAGYTVGNDVSSRDIEGANPLYLPQAKVYDGSCALGPGILIRSEPLPPDTRIALEIAREDRIEFSASIPLSEMKRDPASLVEYLFRNQSFPYGCVLLTGTGIVPPDSFTLQSGDTVRISIDGIGMLANCVA